MNAVYDNMESMIFGIMSLQFIQSIVKYFFKCGNTKALAYESLCNEENH
jgi:hypothetical protein